jgi:excisionase family DNA binding protein
MWIRSISSASLTPAATISQGYRWKLPWTGIKAEDIADMLGLKVQTIYTMARRGELEKVKLSRRCLRFRAGDVERFIERKAAT